MSVPIGARALELLTALTHAEGRALAKDELSVAVWSNSIVEENTLHAQISVARKALGGEARRLVTVHGRGYRLDFDRSTESSHKPDRASITLLQFENTSNVGAIHRGQPGLDNFPAITEHLNERQLSVHRNRCLNVRDVEGFRAPTGVLNPDRYDPRWSG